MEDDFMWQDREIRFDIPQIQIKLRKGEQHIDTITNIEDTKGNEGKIGTFVLSNLRIIWYWNNDIKQNLSIGYDSISEIKETSDTSKIKGETQAINIKCKSNERRFDLIFNSVSDSEINLFKTINPQLKIYESSRLFRDVRFKSNITKNKKITLLFEEKVIEKYPQVLFTVSSEGNKANIGQWLLTNLRIIWISGNIENYNLSMPWIQVRTLKSKSDSMYGKAIWIENMKFFGTMSYSLMHQTDIETINNQMQKIYSEVRSDPILGINVAKLMLEQTTTENATKAEKIREEGMKQFEDVVQKSKKDETEIMDHNFLNETSSALKYSIMKNQDKRNVITDIVFSQELGLAAERLPDNIKIDNLWKIIN